MAENTSIGISEEVRDRAKIHIIQQKDKYESLTDFVNKAVITQIERDLNDTDSKTTE